MSNEEIKERCHAAYAKIEEAEEELDSVRLLCKHEHTHLGIYSWRAGSYDEVPLCDYCNTPIYPEEKYESWLEPPHPDEHD